MMMPEEQFASPFLEHLRELRRRLFYSFVFMLVAMIAAYVMAAHIYNFLIQPLADSYPEGEGRLIYTHLTEAFFTYLKLAFFTAVFIGLPFLLIQVWGFIAPGLYKAERQNFLPFLIATPLLFWAGAAFVYYVVMPMAWPFFLSFQQMGGAAGALPIHLEARIGEYLSLTLSLVLAFGLAFELPVVMALLARAGIIRAAQLRRFRRYGYVCAFVVAAFLTPPDVLTQIALAVPIIFLYECSIILVQWLDNDHANAG